MQGELLTSGQARVYGLPGSYACMRELLAHERVAREASRGLWANAAYAVRSARRTRELLRRRNSYEIVAGTAVKVAVTKARTYINFGADWRSDFTAGIEARVLRANPEWAQTLAGARRQAHRGARLDPVPQRAVHRHRGSEPDRAGRGDAARTLAAAGGRHDQQRSR